MRKFKDFIIEANGPTMRGNDNGAEGGFSSTASDPVAGYDPKLFPHDMDLLSQDFQTPAEPGEDRYNRFASIYPVMKVTLGNNLGDGPSIDSMVAASKEFVNREAQKTVDAMKKTYQRFMGYR